MSNTKEQVYNSFKTICEMLVDRKVDTSHIDMSAVAEAINSNFHKNGFEVIIDNIKIVYYLANKFKFTELRDFYKEEAQTYTINILVIQGDISQNNLKMLNALVKNIQIFDIKRLQFNITKHALQPAFEVISPEEVKRVMDIYKLRTKSQLPVIQKSDAMAKYLGLKSGDVVRITRKSPTAGETVGYRCCG